MAAYIVLMTLTPEGRRRMLDNPDSFLSAANRIKVAGVEVMGMYAALGEYDFVGILSAPGNDEAARFSLELGVAAGVQTTTMPAIPIGRFERTLERGDPLEQTSGAPEPAPATYESAPS